MDRGLRTLRAIFAVAVVTIALGACGSDGPAANLRPTTTIAGGIAPPPPTDAPTEPDAPAEPGTPEATEPATEPPTEPAATAEPEAPAEPEPVPEATAPPASEPNPILPDEDDYLQTFLVLGGLLLAAAVIVAVIARSRKSEPADAVAPSAQSSLLSTSQWITDQLSLELMAAAPAAARQRWSVERSRLDNVAIGAQQQYLGAEDANWQSLAQAMSTLAAAIDTNLRLRAQEPPSAQLVDESTAVVNRHRANLHALIAALWPTIDR